MTTYCLPRQSVSRLFVSMSLAAFAVNAQVPAQLPLLVKPGAGVSPNIMVTMDDSGSMLFRYGQSSDIYLFLCAGNRHHFAL